MYDSETSDSKEILEPLKNISDNQFYTNIDNLDETLIDACTYPIQYERFILNDLIENDYFTIKSIEQIDSSFGDVQLKIGETPEVIWNLSELVTGEEVKLTMDVELKDIYVNNIGIYPTSKGGDVDYKIETLEEKIANTQTTVLSSYYDVNYDLNLPKGCSVERGPTPMKYQVYDSVKIDETHPICEGYRFDGWKVVTENTWQMDEDYFFMPEHNVLLRAEWSKLSIVKSTEGDVFVVYPPVLQNTMYGYTGEFWQYKEQITKVVFQNEVRLFNNTKESFDVSAERNGSVLARLVANQEDLDTYTVYIQGEGSVIANRDLNNIFDGFINLVSIAGLEILDTSNTINMDGAFANCQSLKSIDLSGFDTSQVTDMSHMFNNCRGLVSLNINQFNTANVANMTCMFNYCQVLSLLNLSCFNTSQVTDMSYMFNNCEALTNLNLNNFNTSNVTNMYAMFKACGKLESLDVSSFNTSKVTNMGIMFSGCEKLLSLDSRGFDTFSVVSMEQMFIVVGD